MTCDFSKHPTWPASGKIDQMSTNPNTRQPSRRMRLLGLASAGIGFGVFLHCVVPLIIL